MFKDLETLCVRFDDTLNEAIKKIGLVPVGIVLVVDNDGKLLGTITDGDIRRAILAKTDFNKWAQVILDTKQGTLYAEPIYSYIEDDPAEYLKMLREHQISHLPLIDKQFKVAGLVTLDEFMSQKNFLAQAVIMAGGKGERLRPLTVDTPKPMLPIGDKPLMEIILDQLREAGIRQVNVTTHHKSEKITQHFGDGSNFGLQINYVTEDRPLGTVGGLTLMEPPAETTLVMNGDILTQIGFKAMLDYHREHDADLTMAVQMCDIQIPYGVIECEGTFITRLTEKPQLDFMVNAGIYLLEPNVFSLIPKDTEYDMTDLVQDSVDKGLTVVAFPIREYWIDIGKYSDYEQAQEDLRVGKVAP